jgi:hypothetical protein
MKLNRKANDKWIIRIVLLASIISAIVVMFLMTKIDAIVHRQLYSFGLQYDRSWDRPYNLYTQLMYVGLAVPITLSALGIALSFKKKNSDATEIATAKPAVSKQETIAQPKPQPITCEEPKTKEKEAKNGGSGMVISCPSCKKVFSRPLVMLNFEGGKTRLMNVCPYCNHVLGSAEDEKSQTQDFQVADTDKKLIH